jgi:hypothetical protein
MEIELEIDIFPVWSVYYNHLRRLVHSETKILRGLIRMIGDISEAGPPVSS